MELRHVSLSMCHEADSTHVGVLQWHGDTRPLPTHAHVGSHAHPTPAMLLVRQCQWRCGSRLTHPTLCPQRSQPTQAARAAAVAWEAALEAAVGSWLVEVQACGSKGTAPSTPSHRRSRPGQECSGSSPGPRAQVGRAGLLADSGPRYVVNAGALLSCSPWREDAGIFLSQLVPITRHHCHACDATGRICGKGPGQHVRDRGHHRVWHGSPRCTEVTAQGGQHRLSLMYLTDEGCDEGTDGHGVRACFTGVTRPGALAMGSATARTALAA